MKINKTLHIEFEIQPQDIIKRYHLTYKDDLDKVIQIVDEHIDVLNDAERRCVTQNDREQLIHEVINMLYMSEVGK